MTITPLENSVLSIEVNDKDAMYNLAELSLRNKQALSFMVAALYNTNLKVRYTLNNILQPMHKQSLCITVQEGKNSIIFSVSANKEIKQFAQR